MDQGKRPQEPILNQEKIQEALNQNFPSSTQVSNTSIPPGWSFEPPTTGGVSYPPLATYTLLFQSRELEHKDRIYLMQRYFAWSIYGLIFLWLSAVLVFVLLNSLSGECSWIHNAVTIGGLSSFWGIIAGIVYTFHDNHDKRKTIIFNNHDIISLENYYKDLLKNIVSGGFAFGTLGIILGVFLNNSEAGCIIRICTSSSVLITLIGSTTIGVLGIFACVMKWLFPSKEHISKKHDN